MIPIRIQNLVMPGFDTPSIIVLRPIEDAPEGMARVVPIWIGQREAAILNIALEQVKTPRPLTHDLFLDALTNLDARVERVEIVKVEGQKFYAKLTLRQHDRLIELDARPSDALALAVRQDAPLFIDEDVLARASFPYLYKEGADQEMMLEQFHAFLKDVLPEDFQD